jgi:hypothetical protein
VPRLPAALADDLADGVRQHNLNLAGAHRLPAGCKQRFYNHKGCFSQFIGGGNLSIFLPFATNLVG